MTVGAMDLPPEGMLLGGVALAGDPARGTATTEGLSLLFTSAGITVQGAQPESERLLPWAGLDSATCHDQTELPGGRTATVLVLTSGGQAIHFLLPPETVSPGQAAYLDQAMPAWLDRYRGAGVPPAAPATPPPAAAAGAAVAAAAARPPVETAPAPAPPAPAPPAPATPVSAGPPTAPTPAVEGAVPTPPGAPSPGQDPAGMPGPASGLDPAAAADPLAAPETGKPPRKTRKEKKTEAAAAAIAGAGAGGAAGDAPPPPPFAPPGAPTQPDPFATPGTPPLSPLPAESADDKAPTNRRTLVLLIVLLVVVLGAGGYFLAKRKNVSTTPPTPTTVVSPAAQDKALAVSINLRSTDLPAGWVVASRAPGGSGQSPSTAVTAFASCLGMPAATIGQLFGGGPQTDVSAAASSPVFRSPTDATVQMQSNTNVVKTAADATADATPFAKPNFVTCFQQFETATAVAAVPGASASVTQVTLTAPAGVTAYGYVTTFTVPGQGTKVEGDAFIVGGRIEATLVPTTQGAAVPSDAFSMAYNAMVGRVAAAKNR